MGKGDPKGGRPEYVLTDDGFERLKKLINIHCTQVEVCDVLGVTDKTLNKALKERGELPFSEFYKKHSNEGRASLRREQWKAAQKGNTSMLIWLGKQLLGQKDKIEQDNTSSDGSHAPDTIIIKGAE